MDDTPLSSAFNQLDGILEEDRKKNKGKKPVPAKGSTSAVTIRKGKVSKIVEKFVDDIAAELCLDEEGFLPERATVPWSQLFYNRMVEKQTLSVGSTASEYYAIFSSYLMEKGKDAKKTKYINVAKSMAKWLDLHEVDIDNAIIGMGLADRLKDFFEAWLENPTDHKADAEEKRQKEGMSDPRALYFLGYPAKRGDLVAARINLKDEKSEGSVDLRKTLRDAKYVAEQPDTIMLYARIQDAVEFNKVTFLKLWVMPTEEHTISVNSNQCLPLVYLMKKDGKSDVSQWLGNAELIRSMIQDPFHNFYEYLKRENQKKIYGMFEKHGVYHPAELISALNHPPVSFLWWGELLKVRQILKCWLWEEAIELSPDKALTKEGLEYLEGADKMAQIEMKGFMDELNSGASTSKLFMPTSGKDLAELKELRGKRMAYTILQEMLVNMERTNKMLQTEERELLCGNLKNQITKWWLLLINQSSDMVLASNNFNTKCFSVDNYCDEPPSDIEGVKTNLQFIQDMINPRHEKNSIIRNLTQDMKREIYAVINDFILKAVVVITTIVTDEYLTPEFDISQFNLEEMRSKLEARKEDLTELHGEEKYKRVDDLLKDLKYLMAMQEMERVEDAKTEEELRAGGGKLQLSYAVPVSGLVMGYFVRLENVLKTVLELWDVKGRAAAAAGHAASPSPSGPLPPPSSAPPVPPSTSSDSESKDADDDPDDKGDDGATDKKERKKKRHQESKDGVVKKKEKKVKVPGTDIDSEKSSEEITKRKPKDKSRRKKEIGPDGVAKASSSLKTRKEKKAEEEGVEGIKKKHSRQASLSAANFSGDEDEARETLSAPSSEYFEDSGYNAPEEESVEEIAAQPRSKPKFAPPRSYVPKGGSFSNKNEGIEPNDLKIPTLNLDTDFMGDMIEEKAESWKGPDYVNEEQNEDNGAQKPLAFRSVEDLQSKKRRPVPIFPPTQNSTPLIASPLGIPQPGNANTAISPRNNSNSEQASPAGEQLPGSPAPAGAPRGGLRGRGRGRARGAGPPGGVGRANPNPMGKGPAPAPPVRLRPAPSSSDESVQLARAEDSSESTEPPANNSAANADLYENNRDAPLESSPPPHEHIRNQESNERSRSPTALATPEKRPMMQRTLSAPKLRQQAIRPNPGQHASESLASNIFEKSASGSIDIPAGDRTAAPPRRTPQGRPVSSKESPLVIDESGIRTGSGSGPVRSVRPPTTVKSGTASGPVPQSTLISNDTASKNNAAAQKPVVSAAVKEVLSKPPMAPPRKKVAPPAPAPHAHNVVRKVSTPDYPVFRALDNVEDNFGVDEPTVHEAFNRVRTLFVEEDISDVDDILLLSKSHWDQVNLPKQYERKIMDMLFAVAERS